MESQEEYIQVAFNILTSVTIPDLSPLETQKAIEFIDDLYNIVRDNLPDNFRYNFERVTSGQTLRSGVLQDQSSFKVKNNPLVPLYIYFYNILKILLARHGVSIYSAPLWRRYLNILYAGAHSFISGSLEQVKDAVKRCHYTIPFVQSNVFSDCDFVLEIDEVVLNYVEQKQSLLAQLHSCVQSEKLALWEQIFALESQFCTVRQDVLAQKFIASRQLFNFECALSDCNYDYFVAADVAIRIYNFYFTPVIDIAGVVCRCDLQYFLGLSAYEVVQEASKRELAVGVIQRSIFHATRGGSDYRMMLVAYCEILLNALRSDLAEIVIAKMLDDELRKEIVDSAIVLYLIKHFLQKGRLEIAKRVLQSVKEKVDSLFYTNLAYCCAVCGQSALDSIFADLLDEIVMTYYWDQQLLAVLYYGLRNDEMRAAVHNAGVEYSAARQAYLEYAFCLQCGFKTRYDFKTQFLGDFASFVRFPPFTDKLQNINANQYYRIIFDKTCGFTLSRLTQVLPFENYDDQMRIRVLAPNHYETELIASFKKTNDFFKAFTFTGCANYIVDDVQQKIVQKDKFAALRYPTTTPQAVYNVLERTRRIWSEGDERSNWKQATMPWDMVLDYVFSYNVGYLVGIQALHQIGLKY